MRTRQHTLKSSVTVSGIGLHTGAPCTMTFVPAKINHGYKFQRIDLEGKPIIDADCDYVVDTSRGTTLEYNGVRVHTVEHVLAAFVGLEIDNALIQLDGPEPPIMDGSSLAFVQAIQSVGVEEQNAMRNFFEVPEGIFYKDDSKNIELAALPLNDYRVTVMVDYGTQILGSQHASISTIEEFATEIAACRTFCFLRELEMLRKANLIRGGNFNNAIVIVDQTPDQQTLDDLAKMFGLPKVEVQKEGILNNVALHFPNEPARHKLLDVVGDLALVGRPLKAQILAARPGHAANVALAKKIKKAMLQKNARNEVPVYDPTAPAVLDINQIMQVLPHAYPFRMVDRIYELTKEYVTGIKQVTINEPFFVGHFPGNPVMPGVLQLEAMAQVGGILVLNTVDNPVNYWTYFIGIDSCRFKKLVRPGDTLVIRCELLEPIRRGIARMKGQAFVGGQLVCEASMSASLVRKEQATN